MTEPITTELRGVMSHTTMAGIPLVELGEYEFASRCDAIDAVHSNLERENESLRRELDRVLGEQDDRDGWVRLPVDADGEYIHIGDRMENNERVSRIVLTDDDWEPSVYLEKIPNVLHEYFCNEISHYHPDTWERIIEDATALGAQMGRRTTQVDDLVARCKALAGDAE